MLLLPCGETACVERKMQRSRDAFHCSVPFHEQPYEIGISAGYGVFSQSGDVAKLMQHADEAMYGNKKTALRSASRDGAGAPRR